MEAEAPRSSRSSNRIGYWALALLIAGILLYFSLRGIQWTEVAQVLANAYLPYVFAVIIAGTFALAMRALRWRILLQSGALVPFSTAFWATSAGYFGNNFLPARAGEVIRALMVSRKSGLGKTFVLTTALSERLCDAVALVLISSVVLLTLPVRPGWFNHAARPFAILGIGGTLAIAILPKLENVWKRLVQHLPLNQSVSEKITGILEQILVGIRSFHDAGRLSRYLLLTGVIWLSDAVGAMIGMRALHLEVSLPVALLLITGLGLGSALPSTPGYVGIYQFVAVSVLVPFGFSRTDAVAYILLAQALQYVLISFWGLFGFLKARTVQTEAPVGEPFAVAIASDSLMK